MRRGTRAYVLAGVVMLAAGVGYGQGTGQANGDVNGAGGTGGAGAIAPASAPGGAPSIPASPSIPGTSAPSGMPSASGNPSAATAATSTAATPASAPTTMPAATASAPAATMPAATASAPAATQGGATELGKVVVPSDLDAARDFIAPSLGARTYTIGPEQIEAVPGGENASFQQLLLRAPGVVPDSDGQIHVRGEHGNLTYRINGVLLPEPLNGFGQEIDTHLIQSLTLIDGSLPAQFGFRTAGIADITTKAGDSLKGSEISMYGGSFDTFKTSFETGGTDKKLDYFFTGTYTHDDLGIENPTGNYNALHDYTSQERLFGYLSYHIDDSSRLSLLVNSANADFQIPNTTNLAPAFTFNGVSTADSRFVNENQNEQEYYTVLSYQKTYDSASFQVSAFSRYGQIRFTPDVGNDLIFQGVAGAVYNNTITHGMQFDGALILGDDHTLRGGMLADYTTERLDTSTAVFPVDSNGAQTSDQAETINDDSGNHALEAGAYIQDEWRIGPKLTVNYGLRYDRFDANFDNEGQVSPRINVVLTLDKATTVHAGYSRYFVPPPIENVSSATLNKFANTTNAPANFLDNAPRVERSNYFDAGISHKITEPWQIGLDGFYKQAHQLVDLGQFGDAVILSPYNYSRGTVYGAELSSTYSQGGLSLFGNYSWVKTMAHDIDTQQFEFANDELAFIQDHNIKLDHESEFTISAGASYAWKYDRVFADVLYGSGLRAGFANEDKEPAYYPVNLGYEHIIKPSGWGRQSIKLRVDVVNVFDQSYQLRDGSGLGVGGAPQYGERRGVFVGISYAF